jgi:hypothetical protein
MVRITGHPIRLARLGQEEITMTTDENKFGGVTPKGYPKPTEPEPDLEQIEKWVYDSVVEATDGCEVEPDGICPHGYPSWLIYLGYI